MKSSGRILLSLAGLLIFLLVWEWGGRYVQSHLLPTPSRIPFAIFNEIRSGRLIYFVKSSLGHYFWGVSAGIILGITIGSLVSLIPILDASSTLIFRILRPIPPIAWIPLAIIWLGITETAAAFIISIGVFWVNFFATITAIRSVDDDLMEVAVLYGHGSFLRRIFQLIFPAASPGILGGMRTSLGQGWMTVVAAELFGIVGIGQRIVEASGYLATDIVVSYMLTISLLYGTTDFVFAFITNRILIWQKS